MPKNQNEHQPVLLAEVMSILSPHAGDSYLDLTAGYGGHAQAILAATQAAPKAILVDRDPQAAHELAALFGGSGAKIRNQAFLDASRELAAAGAKFDLILADLGVSSPHFNEADRGFSFSRPGPLDMRMDRLQKLTAGHIVNRWDEDPIADILRRYGQEPKARQLAKLIVRHRPLESTAELAKLAKQLWPGRRRVHPATRAFQALRMAVNDELNQLESALPLWLELLAPGGRLAVISFHSLEDGAVKRFMAEHSAGGYDAQLKLLAKKPITPSASETAFNPRARSAKLRAAVKIKTERIKGNIHANSGSG